MLTIEGLRERHRKQLAAIAFRHAHHRDPCEKELHHWVERLSCGLGPKELLRELHANDTHHSSATPLIDGATHAATVSQHATDEPEMAIQGISIDDLLPLSNEDFVDAIYQRFLGRPADSDGKKHHIDVLNMGATRIEMMRGMANSEEGRRHQLLMKSRTMSDPLLSGAIDLSSQAKLVLARIQACSGVC